MRLCEEGCGRAVIALGLCESHYRAQRREASPECSIEGCTNQGKTTKGWCYKHYSRWQRQGDPTLVVEECAICPHPDRTSIETRILGGAESWVSISVSLGMGRWAASTHARRHMGIRRPNAGAVCAICTHPDSDLIDLLLESGARGSQAEATRRFDLPRGAAGRHVRGRHADDPLRAERVAVYELRRLTLARSGGSSQ